MISFLTLLFILAVIYVGFTNNKGKKGQTSTKNYYSQDSFSSVKKSANSLYTKREIFPEKPSSSLDEVDDLCDNIGYIKCPNCGATVSKKSTTCFMCNFPLAKEEEKHQSE